MGQTPKKPLHDTWLLRRHVFKRGTFPPHRENTYREIPIQIQIPHAMRPGHGEKKAPLLSYPQPPIRTLSLTSKYKCFHSTFAFYQASFSLFFLFFIGNLFYSIKSHVGKTPFK